MRFSRTERNFDSRGGNKNEFHEISRQLMKIVIIPWVDENFVYF